MSIDLSNYEGPYYAYGEENDFIAVVKLCPICGRFLKQGRVFTNSDGDVTRMEGFECKKHNEVQPECEYS